MNAYIERLMMKERETDTSFTGSSGFLGLFSTKYTQAEVREIWFRGKRSGIEIGLQKASLEGQRLEAYHNITDPKHKEFLDKFYALAAEYECGIQYHPELGMCVIDREFK